LTITGATRVAGVIGDPVRHSLSPVLHNAAYRELGLDWIYVAFEVPDGATRDALAAMRVLGLAGLSVTMPHKTAAAEACDALSADAAALRSVNTVSLGADGRLAGDSTDGEGFLRSLRDAGHDPGGATVVLLGAGGAARAVARASAGLCGNSSSSPRPAPRVHSFPAASSSDSPWRRHCCTSPTSCFWTSPRAVPIRMRGASSGARSRRCPSRASP